MPFAAGVGLRFPHQERFLGERPQVAWLEVHAENYLGGGTARRCLDTLRRDYPLSLHGVGLSLGSAEGLDPLHLERIAALVEQLQPQLVSEHLSWSVVDRRYLADLLPLPMTEESLEVMGRHVEQVQERLRRPILIENPSTYLEFEHSSIPEWEFLDALARRTGCGLLCDVNNVFVSASNHGWDACEYLRGLPAAAIGEVHLAGHTTRILPDGAIVRIDDHGSRVAPAVWELYRQALRLFGPRPTLIEWDTDIPALETLMEEAAHAQLLLDEAAPAESRAAHDPEPSPSRPGALEHPRSGTPRAHDPPLLHVQRSMGRCMLDDVDAAIAAGPTPVPGLEDGGLTRLSIYINTGLSVRVNALRLTFPAVQRLVGAEFFEGAARHFMALGPNATPAGAWLNEYGEELIGFLASFPPALGIPYLADVARLEWAVNRALHAPDRPSLALERLGRGSAAPGDLRFVPHGAVSLLSLGSPADAIWRAVLEGDDAALRCVDLSDAPVWLLIERDAAGVQVRRLAERAWRFMARLCAGEPLHAALDELAAQPALHDSAASVLAEHLAAGRFIDTLPGELIA